MNKVLMRIVVQNMVFLELSSDDIVNPDAAVREMDMITGALEDLGESDRKEFIAFINAAAEEAKKARRSDDYVEFLRSIPEAFGLIEEAD